MEIEGAGHRHLTQSPLSYFIVFPRTRLSLYWWNWRYIQSLSVSNILHGWEPSVSACTLPGFAWEWQIPLPCWVSTVYKFMKSATTFAFLHIEQDAITLFIWKLYLTALDSLWNHLLNLPPFLQPPTLLLNISSVSKQEFRLGLLTLPILLGPSHPFHGFHYDLSIQSILT